MPSKNAILKASSGSRWACAVASSETSTNAYVPSGLSEQHAIASRRGKRGKRSMRFSRRSMRIHEAARTDLYLYTCVDEVLIMTSGGVTCWRDALPDTTPSVHERQGKIWMNVLGFWETTMMLCHHEIVVSCLESPA